VLGEGDKDCPNSTACPKVVAVVVVVVVVVAVVVDVVVAVVVAVVGVGVVVVVVVVVVACEGDRGLFFCTRSGSCHHKDLPHSSVTVFFYHKIYTYMYVPL
jgi:hypothetical protein